MKRVLGAVTTAALLVAMLPGAVSADRVTKFEDHHVGGVCETPFDGGFVLAFLDSSTTFGTFAQLEIWLDPALPFEESPTFAGFTEAIDVAQSPEEVVLGSTMAVFDADGNDAGEASIVMTLAPDGDPEIIEGDDFGNRNSHTTGVFQPLSGSAVLTLPDGTAIAVEPCFGDITDIEVHDTNPRAFTANNEGVVIDCFWESDDVAAGFFAIDDAFGFFADAFLATVDGELFLDGDPSGFIDATGVEAEVPLTGGELASAEATFTPVGEPVTSMLVNQNGRIKTIEQALAPEGSVEFSTGHSFTIDDEACNARTFSEHIISTSPAGPRPKAPPVNDTPDGAIALEPGDRIQVDTTGTAVEPEVPITTCPEGFFDDMGHTVWYTVEGTGDVLTADTAGTHFDTVMAVYVMEGDELVEIACVDDVLFEPIGQTFQAAISGPTEEGVTYWIQVGGFRNFFDPSFAESGRLKLSIE